MNLLEIRKLILSQEEILKEEIFNLMNEKDLILNNSKEEIKTIITLGIKKTNLLFKNLNYNIVDIYENIPKESSLKEKVDFIDSIKGENLVVIFDDKSDLELLKSIKNKYTLCYISTNNSFFENINHIKDNKILVEKNISDISDLIITDDINVYNYKTILENRDNVYLIDENISDEFRLEYIVNNFLNIDRENINEILKEYGKNIKDRYQKLLFLISSQAFDNKSCIELCEYGYKKYNKKELFNLYIGLLAKSKDYMKLVSVVFNSSYLDDIYKAEIIYLESTKRYDLLEFIVNIVTNNLNVTIDNNSYKLAINYMILNDFSSAYDEYTKILNDENYVLDSPLINKNIYYILKSKNDENYNYYYDRYNLLKTECLNTYYNGDN